MPTLLRLGTQLSEKICYCIIYYESILRKTKWVYHKTEDCYALENYLEGGLAKRKYTIQKLKNMRVNTLGS